MTESKWQAGGSWSLQKGIYRYGIDADSRIHHIYTADTPAAGWRDVDGCWVGPVQSDAAIVGFWISSPNDNLNSLQLAAAAPALLEACQAAIDEANGEYCARYLELAAAAIAAATGE